MKEFTLEKIRKHPDYKRMYQEESQLLDIAIAISEMRQKQKLTQQKLAKLMGTNQSVISRIERGIENISLKRLFKLAEVLGAQVEINVVYPKTT